MSRAIRSILIITILAVATISFSSAYFSDTETSSGNVLSAGSIDLKINDLDNPPAIVSFNDLKPGDNHVVPKKLRVVDNDAHVWMHIVSYQSSQGIQTEPETVEESGTPKHDIENYIYYDLGFVGSDEIISLGDEVRFPDAVSCWVPLGQLTGGTEYTLNQSFHFDADVTNWAQGDELAFTEEFYAVQARNNPNPAPPISQSGRVWNPQTRNCEDSRTLVETVVVPMTTSNPTISTLSTVLGKNYILEVSGKYIYWPTCNFAPGDQQDPDFPGKCVADAEFALRPTSSFGPGWKKGEDIYSQPEYLDLLVNGLNIDWAASPNEVSHTYQMNYLGDGSPVSFNTTDSYLGDNSGSLTVKIYELN